MFSTRWIAIGLVAATVAWLGPRPALAAAVKSIAVGGAHACAVTSGGAVWCWGGNQYKQLGDGTTIDRATPVSVDGLSGGVVALAAGRSFTCALTSGGAVWCWGVFGTFSPYTLVLPTPVAISGLPTDIVDIAAGWGHACALTAAGQVWCWGKNNSGQLGDGTRTDRATPVPVNALTGIVALTAGLGHTCALDGGGGAVQCWGSNSSGQLGDGTTTDALTPVAVGGLAPAASVTAGLFHSCALTSGGEAWCWGENFSGQLGDGTTVARETPIMVGGLPSGLASLTAGGYHTCAVTAAGASQCWGDNSLGQLGDGTTTSAMCPVAVAGLAGAATRLSVGATNTCAVTSRGAAQCWGSNTDGQLGYGGRGPISVTPITVLGMTGALLPPDVTGDGRSDILWRHATRGEVWLWRMMGPAIGAQSYLGAVADAGWAVQAVSDMTGDGMADLLWRHATSGELRLWTMNGASVSSVQVVATVSPAYSIAAVGDLDGDGKSDIVWRQATTGELWVWLMNGAAVRSSTRVAIVDPLYAVVGAGDLDGDGKVDLLWRHRTAGDVHAWRMDGTAVVSQAYVGTVGDMGYEVVGVTDLTGDGRADVLWRHATSGELWLWQQASSDTTVSETYLGAVDPGYRVVATGDYDGDGMADILWQHPTRGEVWVWLMNGAAVRSATHVAIVGDVGYQVQR
jgi:alpha-tubulin suppressor-like RCC1 family protein